MLTVNILIGIVSMFVPTDFVQHCFGAELCATVTKSVGTNIDIPTSRYAYQFFSNGCPKRENQALKKHVKRCEEYVAFSV